jgi:tRNA-dihydrouridine synthase C
MIPSDFWTGKTNRVLLAPMEGVVDAVMRELLTRIGGIDLCVTEFIRVTDRPLPDSEFLKYCPELLTDSKTLHGVPVQVQLLGGRPDAMAENAVRACHLGAPGIDLNFGCPAKTVNRHDGGAALLQNPHRLYDVIAAVRAAIPQAIPVTAKVRLGFDSKDLHLDIARAVEQAGASWLTVHARTRNEGYRPPAHWEYISHMREAISLPVIANGEIWHLADYQRARQVSGCRHVMIGRGLMSSPGLARAIKATSLSSSKDEHGPLEQWSELVDWLLDFAKASQNYRSEHYSVCRVKQWLKSLSRTHINAEQLFTEIKRHETLTPITAALYASRET